jgi:glycerol kinase
MERYVLSLDQGTTSSRAIIFDHKGAILASAQKEFTQFYPKPGWVEHDAREIWSSQASVVAESMSKAGIDGRHIAGIGITNQRETTILWDRETGEPVHRAIVWQDRRTSDYCDELKAQGLTDTVQGKTGLLIDSYFSGTKIRWILDHVPGVRKRAEQGKIAFGTVDTWLVWKLTHGQRHITDVTNASRTMLFNIHSLEWDVELLELLGIPESILPTVKTSSEIYGDTGTALFGSKIPIAGIAGDQQAALFGQMCISPGMLKNTYGTGGFLVLNTGDKPIQSQHNLLTTIAWQIGDRVDYALEGSIFIAGAVVQWLRDGLGMIQSSSEIEALAQTVEDNGGVYLVPAFAGLGAPHWDQSARGTIMGITRGTTRGHIARAALESIAFQTHDVMKAMEADSNIKVKELRVDGGATVNNALMQFQSDILGIPIVRPKISETTALGAAYLAGLAVGYWDDFDSIQRQWAVERTYEPQMGTETIDDLITHWNRAVGRTKNWLKDA